MKRRDDNTLPEAGGHSGRTASGKRRTHTAAGATGDSDRQVTKAPRQVKSADNRSAFALVCNLLREGQCVSVRVEGQSMLPFFQSGSVVNLRPLTEGDLAPGHVVLGRTEAGSYVIHRILRISGSRVVLLGDGNTVGTETIPREHIYGIVDCGPLHLASARVWSWMRPVRKYPLWVLRRICRK